MGVMELWWLSLTVAAIVIVVVAVLLGLIIGTAKQINGHAAQIWTVGKQIAGNTVSIWMLQKTNELASGSLEAVQSMDRTMAAMSDRLTAHTPGRD